MQQHNAPLSRRQSNNVNVAEVIENQVRKEFGGFQLILISKWFITLDGLSSRLPVHYDFARILTIETHALRDHAIPRQSVCDSH